MSEARLSKIVLVCAAIGGAAYYLTGSTENIWRKVKLDGIGTMYMLSSNMLLSRLLGRN